MVAGNYELYIEQGTTFTKVLTYKDSSGTIVDLTNYTARSQGRTSIKSAITAFNLTTENGGITLGGVLGTITLIMDDTTTSALMENCGVWDLELIDGVGTVIRLIKGRYVVDPEVTR